MASVKAQAIKEIEKGKVIAARIIRAGEQMLNSMNSLEKKLLNEKIDYSTIENYVNWDHYFRKTQDDDFVGLLCPKIQENHPSCM